MCVCVVGGCGCVSVCVQMNDLDQVHTADDIHHWAGLPCQVSSEGAGECFNDGHCRPSCRKDGTCAIMPSHHNTKGFLISLRI